MILIVPATVTGTGQALPLSSIPGAPKQCKWFQLVGATIVVAGGSRIGDKNVSATRGVPLQSGGGQFNPPIALGMDFYDLTNIWYFLASGDSAVLACAV